MYFKIWIYIYMIDSGFEKRKFKTTNQKIKFKIRSNYF